MGTISVSSDFRIFYESLRMTDTVIQTVQDMMVQAFAQGTGKEVE